MKTKFYNTHTEVDNINDLDGKWLKKRLSDYPFDVQYKYLQALVSLTKGKQSSYIKSIGKLLFDTNGHVRIGALLQRSEASQENGDNVLDTVSIKSKKSVKTIENSAILAGLTEVNPELYKNKKRKQKGKRKKQETLEVDTIIVEDDVSEKHSIYEDSRDNEDEVEEYLSPSIPDNSDLQSSISGDVLTPQHMHQREEQSLTPSELVQIEHSSFTTWLQGLPSISALSTEQDSQEPTTQVISEPLARLLGSQGHKADAIMMYKQLMLKYPEKSGFFADQIKKLS